MRIFNANASTLDAADPPRRGSQQEHVPRQALDGEVLIQGSDDGFFRLRDNVVICVFGNSAA